MNRQTKVTAEKIRTGQALIMFAAIASTGTPARFVDGPAGARHHLLTERAATRRDPRTVRTTHDGRRVIMRRTGRLA
ncbi:hypothetical protein OHB44_28080 [Micromonospora sp. NBC_00821]|uniref:hypothetical protein n=1 Tax=Micromonospora sp. NBC_00821 TaxID=2975977 RepID=UPI002ED236A1|nr:hypothetical protein OHB44_28080 [Micromonospora sp. NBC_00821]